MQHKWRWANIVLDSSNALTKCKITRMQQLHYQNDAKYEHKRRIIDDEPDLGCCTYNKRWEQDVSALQRERLDRRHEVCNNCEMNEMLPLYEHSKNHVINVQKCYKLRERERKSFSNQDPFDLAVKWCNVMCVGSEVPMCKSWGATAIIRNVSTSALCKAWKNGSQLAAVHPVKMF